mgnify:CR=1 FL=1
MENGIRVYNFPRTGLEKEDLMREKQPFAVVGSNIVTVDKNGRKVRGRKYVWGTVDVENEVTNMHCSLNILNVFRIIVIFLL